MAFWSPAHAAAEETMREIPEPLRAWKGWATWDDYYRLCPTPYQDPNKHLCFWPSRLTLDIAGDSGRFDLGVTVFGESWIPLPGGEGAWPIEVKANGAIVDYLGGYEDYLASQGV